MKKRRSAKQRANDKRLGRMAKKRAQKPKRKTRKYTTRKRRTTRKGDLTLKRKRAYPGKRRSSTNESDWTW